MLACFGICLFHFTRKINRDRVKTKPTPFLARFGRGIAFTLHLFPRNSRILSIVPLLKMIVRNIHRMSQHKIHALCLSSSLFIFVCSCSIAKNVLGFFSFGNKIWLNLFSPFHCFFCCYSSETVSAIWPNWILLHNYFSAKCRPV